MLALACSEKGGDACGTAADLLALADPLRATVMPLPTGMLS